MSWSSTVDISTLVSRTRGYCAAEVVGLCHGAGLRALHRNPNATVSNYIQFNTSHDDIYSIANRND